MTQRALVILHPGFEEVEAVTPVDLLLRAGFDVVLTSVGGGLAVTSRGGLELRAHAPLDEVAGDAYDLVLLPGGPGIHKIRKHPLVCDRLRHQASAGRWIGCICAAPLLLLDAGLTNGLRLTCHPSAENELTQAEHEPVVVSHKIVTSRGAGTATDFALALIRMIKDEDAAREVAEAICWPHG